MTDAGEPGTEADGNKSAAENSEDGGLVMGKPINWTDDMKTYIAENYYGITTVDLTERFNNHFGVQFHWTAIAGYKKRNDLRNGIDSRFKKGHIPNNKGKKMPPEIYEKAKETMFKKGNVPKNYRPVGSERVNVDGYREIKVEDPNVWQLKHRVVWEEVNGSIPENHALLFLDGNPLNCEVDNLKLITRSELLAMNRYHLFSKNTELNDAASNLARLIVQTNEAKRRK